MNAKGVIVSSRQEEISYIVRSLKDLALELNIPIIVTCQLNRGVSRDGIEGKRPQLSDLRESDSLEQDSDMIVLHIDQIITIYIWMQTEMTYTT